MMRIEIENNILEQELNNMIGIVRRKSNTRPALSHIAIDAQSDGLIKLSASDLSTSLIITVMAKVQEPGSLCVPAGKLLDIVKLSPDGGIGIEALKNGWAKITTKSSIFKLPSVVRDSFPNLPKTPSSNAVVVPSDLMAKMLSQTIFAMSKVEGNQTLHNLKLEVTEIGVKMVAADGWRLAISQAKRNEEGILDALIPDFTASRLLKLSESSSNDVYIFKSENHLHFHIGNKKLISAVSTGEFPKYELMLPIKIEHSLEFNVERLSMAIHRAALMADEHSHSILLDFKNGKIGTNDPVNGEVHELLPTDTRIPIRISFSHKLLIEILENIDSETVIFDLQNDKSQAQLRPAVESEKDGKKYLCVIMPMVTKVPENESEVLQSKSTDTAEDDFDDLLE